MRILFTGGGSGGHITPIIALARQLKKNNDSNLEMSFLGAAKFSPMLQNEGIAIRTISAGKIRRGGSMQDLVKNFLDVFRTALGMIQSLWWLWYLMPDVIFSKGGFGSVPVVLAAWFYRIPVLVHESDTLPGLANRFAAKFAERIAVSFSETAKFFPSAKTAFTGQPIRLELVQKCLSGKDEDKEAARQMFQIVGSNPIVFVYGGSQGGQIINNLVLSSLPDLLSKYEVIHQCGEKNYQEIQDIVGQNKLASYHLLPFLNEEQAASAYLLADVIVSRAGAANIFEIAACAKPSILIPMDEAAAGHQRENAFTYARYGAAIVLEEGNLTPHLLVEQIDNVLENQELSNKLKRGAKEFSDLTAAEKIVQVLMEMAK